MECAMRLGRRHIDGDIGLLFVGRVAIPPVLDRCWTGRLCPRECVFCIDFSLSFATNPVYRNVLNPPAFVFFDRTLEGWYRRDRRGGGGGGGRVYICAYKRKLEREGEGG